MRELYLGRKLVKCYSTGEEANGIELYASNPSYEDGIAAYYIDSDIDARQVQELGEFASFEEAKKEFRKYTGAEYVIFIDGDYKVAEYATLEEVIDFFEPDEETEPQDFYLWQNVTDWESLQEFLNWEHSEYTVERV